MSCGLVVPKEAPKRCVCRRSKFTKCSLFRVFLIHCHSFDTNVHKIIFCKNIYTSNDVGRVHNELAKADTGVVELIVNN